MCAREKVETQPRRITNMDSVSCVSRTLCNNNNNNYYYNNNNEHICKAPQVVGWGQKVY